jgi:integrase
VSVERRRLKGGGQVWRVRWREGGKNRARNFDLKRDADVFDADLRLRRRRGDLELLDAGRETLADFALEWGRNYAQPNLAATTLKSYGYLWDRHVLNRVGGLPLRAITPEVLESFRADLEKAGVGQASIRKTLILVQSVLSGAVRARCIATNPAAAIRKPPQRRERLVRPLPPAEVEAIRSRLLRAGRHRDATLVSVLAYAGLRPGEALALRWGDVQERTIVVERALAFGEEKATKTGATRSVRLLAPLAQDLNEWRLASGRPGPGRLVFPAADGGPWDDFAWRNWRRRVFSAFVLAARLERVREAVGLTLAQLAKQANVSADELGRWERGERPLPAAYVQRLKRATGAEIPRPYDLRHSFVSLLLAERASVVEIAEQAGHSSTMALNTYGHVIAELRGAEMRSAEDEIRAAREALVPSSYPRAADASRGSQS